MNVLALMLQAFVASRLVKYQGLRGVLLALPLIALGGYSIIAAGAGFALVRWIKTAENATDYSIMNTARQLLWLPTSTRREVQGQTGDRCVLRAERRRALSRARLRGNGRPSLEHRRSRSSTSRSSSRGWPSRWSCSAGTTAARRADEGSFTAAHRVDASRI